MKAWEQHQIVLAANLPYEAWSDARSVYLGIHLAQALAKALVTTGGTISDGANKHLALCVERIHKALVRLNPYLGRPKGSSLSWMTTINRRLLEPLGIRPRIPGPPISG
jgi:hypothetical protein